MEYVVYIVSTMSDLARPVTQSSNVNRERASAALAVMKLVWKRPVLAPIRMSSAASAVEKQDEDQEEDQEKPDEKEGEEEENGQA